MAKKEGDKSPSPSPRDPRVYGPPQDQQVTLIRGMYLTGNEPDEKASPAQAEASIPTEGEGQQQTR